MGWVLLLGLLISLSARADERDDWDALALEPIIDPAVALVVHGDQGELTFEDDEVVVAVQCRRADSGRATTFSIRIENKSDSPLAFHQHMVSFHGSNDSTNWVPLPLVPAAESAQYCERLAGEGRMQKPLPVFLRDAVIKPKGSCAGLLEHAHRAGDPECRYYRLSVSRSRGPAQFHFENVLLDGPDPRPDPTQPGFGKQWRRRWRGGTAEGR